MNLFHGHGPSQGRRSRLLLVAACGLLLGCNRATAQSIATDAEEFWSDGDATFDSYDAGSAEADPAQFSQPLTPRIEAGRSAPQPSVTGRNADLLARDGAPRSLARRDSLALAVSFDTVLGRDATVRATTDAGDLLGSSPQVLNLGVQRRNPIVTDPRVRGSRVGSLAASGSYWVPARIDLDTMVSKLDSHIVERTTVVPGPYSALHGPGLQFIDVDLLRAPQFGGGFETHGRSMVDFKSNGEQWHGRQSFWGGDDVWGFRGGYGHRTGNDYTTGAGTLVPSSYKSRDVDLAFVGALTESSLLDVQYLRIDQTDVELPGQAFDIDVLVTDGFEATLVEADSPLGGELLITTWYNRTTLNGSAQRAGKRRTFPFYDQIGFVGFTDVDSQSTGASGAATWTTQSDGQLTAGADLRYVRQELNEITSGFLGGVLPFVRVNAPIPESHQGNPGLFVEAGNSPVETTRLRAGGRVDFVSTDLDADPSELQMLGVVGQSAVDILGSGDFAQDELLGLGYLAAEHDLTERLVLGAKVGYAERAPNLTEYYAIQPFMFLLQNGLNTVTGDPTLDKERLIQADLSAALTGAYGRTRLNLFHAWARDYITFENIGVVNGLPPPNQSATPVQVNLKYVNTDLATLMGAESESEVNLTSLSTAFLNLKYVEGEDRTRNGDFATLVNGLDPSTRQPGFPRGSFAPPAPATADEEPLPSILPLEARVGLRVGSPADDAPWGVEISSRIVDNQDRVAASLLEMPTPGFTTYDLRGFYRTRSTLLIAAGVENFTDKAFREHLDFRSFDGSVVVLQPGANFYVGGELTY